MRIISFPARPADYFLPGIRMDHVQVASGPVKFTWHGQTLYRYLWGTFPFPMETNCPHLERLPPFYAIVGHIPVPGEFHEGRLVCCREEMMLFTRS